MNGEYRRIRGTGADAIHRTNIFFADVGTAMNESHILLWLKLLASFFIFLYHLSDSCYTVSKNCIHAMFLECNCHFDISFGLNNRHMPTQNMVEMELLSNLNQDFHVLQQYC